MQRRRSREQTGHFVVVSRQASMQAEWKRWKQKRDVTSSPFAISSQQIGHSLLSLSQGDFLRFGQYFLIVFVLMRWVFTRKLMMRSCIRMRRFPSWTGFCPRKPGTKLPSPLCSFSWNSDWTNPKRLPSPLISQVIQLLRISTWFSFPLRANFPAESSTLILFLFPLMVRLIWEESMLMVLSLVRMATSWSGLFFERFMIE